MHSASDDEKKALLPARTVADERTSQVEFMGTALAVLTMIAFSVGMIYFNSYLMKPQHFPYAVPIVACHMGFCSLFSFAIYLLKPSLFFALSDPEKQVSLDIDMILKRCLPLAAVFTAGLVLGNAAYHYLGVAFIQMIKETNIVWVYIVAVAYGLERLSYQATEVIVIAIIALSLTVKGELNFTLLGFVLQLSAVLSEALRINMQTILLSKRGKLDPLSYVLLVCPLCFLLVSAIMVLFRFCNIEASVFSLPSEAALREWAPMLLLSSCVAFGLNLSIAYVITKVSAVGYCFCQLTKDVAAVVVGVLFAGEVVTHMQCFAFALQIFAAYAWAMLKLFPDMMRDGVLLGLCRAHLGFRVTAHQNQLDIEEANKASAHDARK